MRSRIRSFLNTDLSRIFIGNGLATFVKVLAGLISNKVVAVILGPSGIALLGQFQNFVGIANQIGTMGINSGVTKYIAEYKDEETRSRVLSTAFFITLCSTLLTTFVTLVLAGRFTRTLLGSEEYLPVFIVFSLTLILYTYNNLLLSILNGFKEYKKLIKINIISSIVGVGIAVVLVLRYGVYGALLGSILSTTVIFMVNLLFVVQSPWFTAARFLGGIYWPDCKKLMKYSAMTFTSVFAVMYVQLMIRTYIIRHLGIQEAGLWQGIQKISDIYLLIITSTLSMYYLPRLSEIKETKELNWEISKGFKFLLPVTILSTIIIILLRDFITQVLFSSCFFPMRDLFVFQMLGNIIKIAGWLLGYVLIARAMTKLFIILELFFGILNYLITIYAVNHFGIVGTTYAYCVLYILYFMTLYILLRKKLRLNIRLTPKASVTDVREDVVEQNQW